MKIDTVIVGDCLDVMAEMPDRCIDLIVTSPHYNCRKPYSDFQDEMAWGQWYGFMELFLVESLRVMRDGAVMAFNLPGVIRWQRNHAFKHTWQDFDPEYLTHVGGQQRVKGKGRIEPIGFWAFNAMNHAGFKMRELVVWVKGTEENAICSDYRMGCDSDPYMRPCHEFILLGSKGRWYHDGGTGRRGKEAVPFIDFTKNVWHIPTVSTNRHPAPFPEEIPTRLIHLFIHRANTQDLPEPIVADFFIGSGTTAIAALKLGCHFYGCDISPESVKLANERIAKARLEMAQLALEM